jgi:hypothetical protein
MFERRKYWQQKSAAATILHCFIEVIDQVDQTLVILINFSDAGLAAIIPDKQHVNLP